MDKAHNIIDEKLVEIEKKLKSLYSSALSDMQKKSNDYFKHFMSEDEAQKEKVKMGEISEKSYIEWRKKNIMIGNGFTALKEDIAKKLLSVNEIAVAYINDELPEVYSIGYNALEKVVEGVNGYSFALTDANTIKNLVMNGEKSLLPLKSVNAQKDIRWNMKNINSQVLQGIVRGESIPKIAKRIRNVEEMNRDSSIRTARTIVTSAENKGRQDSYIKAESDGIILQKKWLSSNQPGRTRDWHFPNGFESITVDQDKPFVNGYGEIMYPGDPSAHPANVYNCRCSMAAVVKGFKKVQVEKAMEEKKVEEPQTTAFTPAKTTEEAQQYAQRFVYRQEYESKRFGKQVYEGTVDFGKMDKNYANTLNRTMQKVFDDYDIEPLKSIEMMNFREKRWRGAETAGGAYNPYSQGSMYLNPKIFSNRSALERHLKEVQTATEKVLSMADDILERNTSSESLLAQVKAVKESRRLGAQQILNSSQSAEGTFVHEIGHMLDYKKFKSMYKEYGFDVSASMSRYGDKISGYAVSGTDEYIAESFVMHWFGHDELIDPTLKEIFKGALK